MKKTKYARIIYFLAPIKSERFSYIESLQQAANLTIPTITAEEINNDPTLTTPHKIILFDYASFLTLKMAISQLIAKSPMLEFIVVNVPHPLDTNMLLNLGNIKGLFYQQDDLKKIAQGLNAIIDGDNWLPRKAASQLLYHYRHIVALQTTPYVVDLSAREMDILRSLHSGLTNQAIAELLFISEATVKTHLNRIFKKLSVKNRVQAIAWANQHLK